MVGLGVQTLTGVRGAGRALALSRDGRVLATVTAVQSEQGPPDGWFGVWDIGSGRVRGTHQLGIDGASVAFSTTSDRVVAGLMDGHVLVLDDSAKVLRTMDLSKLSSGGITALGFRPDGTLLTGTWSGIVQHWDLDDGKQLGHPVLVESSPVSSIALAPHRQEFAVTGGGSSGGVKLWDDASLQQFGATFPGGTGTWGNAIYTPDGSDVVVAYSDGSAAVWPVTVRAWLDHACAVAGRNLTREEWARFVPHRDYERTCPSYPAG